jgi:DMSO/TMAO reductase YedYZ molybdopterin-dependent catalytic subunit
VRLIIPGFIGGRMIKWLCEISVTEQESQNHYHFFDNKVLPPHVDQELADKEGEFKCSSRFGPGVKEDLFKRVPWRPFSCLHSVV